MRKLLIACIGMLMSVASVQAQTKADDLLGVYKAVQGDEVSKVEFRKNGDGYMAQVTWVNKLKDANGNIRLDVKNPDKSKRNTPINKIVLIDKVTFDEAKGEWSGGRIYDPTRGKFFKVRLSFKDAKTLKVRGSWGPIRESTYWPKY